MISIYPLFRIPLTTIPLTNLSGLPSLMVACGGQWATLFAKTGNIGYIIDLQRLNWQQNRQHSGNMGATLATFVPNPRLTNVNGNRDREK